MLRPLLVLFVLLTVLTGVVYPLVVTGIGWAAFPAEAAGSLVKVGGNTVGSALIGQAFQDPKYFWGRLSATAPMPYGGTASSGSNLGPTNPALLDQVRARIDALHNADPGNTAPIPVDLVTASGSGLDPEISPAAALYQVDRVARVRGISRVGLQQLVRAAIVPPQWHVFGEARVNVLLLNLELERAQ